MGKPARSAPVVLTQEVPEPTIAKRNRTLAKKSSLSPAADLVRLHKWVASTKKGNWWKCWIWGPLPSRLAPIFVEMAKAYRKLQRRR